MAIAKDLHRELGTGWYESCRSLAPGTVGAEEHGRGKGQAREGNADYAGPRPCWALGQLIWLEFDGPAGFTARDLMCGGGGTGTPPPPARVTYAVDRAGWRWQRVLVWTP